MTAPALAPAASTPASRRKLLAHLMAAALGVTFTAGIVAAQPVRPAPRLSGPRLSVVELFTSQGCSSCPPANENVANLAGRPDVLALSFGVTYWDKLGWKDTFASPQFTARQYDYARGLRHDGPFTPQVVVNGRADVVGAQRGEIERLIERTPLPAGPALSARGGEVEIGGGQASGADVWFVTYDPRTVQVPVRAGENDGRTLPHRNVVKALVRLGRWDGQPAHYRLPPPQPGLLGAVFVQSGPGGAILAATKL